jgi:hypothetical protein
VKKRLLLSVVTCSVIVGALLLWTMRVSVELPLRSKDQLGATITAEATPAVPAIIETRRTSDRADPVKIFEAIEATNVPINFWGKIVDQNGLPVMAVKIDYEYSIEHGNLLGVAWSDQETRSGQAVTDRNGLFSVLGLKGHALGILAIKHPDYQFRGKGAVSFDFYGSTASGKFVSDQLKPVVFTVVEKQRLEPLIHMKGNLRVQVNGPPERWSLWQGESDPNGELLVTFRREPAVLQRPGQAATWSADLQIVGGGIIEASWDEDIRQAPEAGYLDSLPYPDREQKQGVPYRSFYVKTADGRFGRLQIELDARGEGASAPCYIASDMNPRPGSRNLEPSEDE